MPGITQRIGILLLLGLLSAGCGGGKSEESTSRIIAPPASGPGSVAWEAAIAGRTSPVPTTTTFVSLEGLSPDRSVLFVRRRSVTNNATTERRLAALDTRTGVVLWTADDVSLYTVSDQTAFLVSRPLSSDGDFTLTARDLHSNSVFWQRNLTAKDIKAVFVSGPVVAALTKVTFESADNPAPVRLIALNRNTGADQWVYERNLIFSRTFASALSQNQIYLSMVGTSQQPEIVSLDANNGSVLRTGANTSGGSPLAGNNALYSLSDTRIRYDDAGHIQWQRALPEGAYRMSPPSTIGADDTLYSIFQRGFSPFIEALDPVTGATKWESVTPPAPPSITPGFDYNVRGIDNSVGVSESGDVYYVESFLYTRVADSTAQFTIASLDAEDGSVRWTVPLFNNRGNYNYDLRANKTLVGPNGLVYGLRDLNIVAVRTPDTQ